MMRNTLIGAFGAMLVAGLISAPAVHADACDGMTTPRAHQICEANLARDPNLGDQQRVAQANTGVCAPNSGYPQVDCTNCMFANGQTDAQALNAAEWSCGANGSQGNFNNKFPCDVGGYPTHQDPCNGTLQSDGKTILRKDPTTGQKYEEQVTGPAATG
jgi:hypothetical protein